MAICQGDIGTNLDFTVVEPAVGGGFQVVTLGGGDTVSYVFWSTTGVRKEFVGIIADGANGLVRYTLLVDDIDEAGPLQIQLLLTIGTWSGCSSIFKTQVITKI